MSRFALWVSLLQLAFGLRISLEAGGPVELGHYMRPSRDLPQKFDSMWKAEGEFNAQKHRTAETSGASFVFPHGDGVKLVVGIPMMTNQQDIRKAHMSTWMKGDGICKLDSFATSSCHIFPVFLYGNSSEAMLAAQETDFGLSLQVPEPKVASTIASDTGYEGQDLGAEATEGALRSMRGKTFEWFKHASASYPKATHIAKMDSDAYPHMALVLEDLATGPKANLYWGAAMGASDCSKGFMQGAFYGISAGLQPCHQRELDATYPAGLFGVHKHHGNEDTLFGSTLYDAVQSGKCPQPTCMSVRSKGRYEHPV